jgi:hypothetical protein
VYGQYKMHGSVINVLKNVDQTQLILSHLPHDGVTSMFLKSDVLNTNHLICEEMFIQIL